MKEQQPIPLNAGNVTGWKSIAIEPSPEPLVPLGAYCAETNAILTSSVYFGEHYSSPYTGKRRLEGSYVTIFVRSTVAQRLLKAQQFLPAGCRLLVFDAYRPLRVQKSLFRFYRDQLCRLQPDMSDAELDEETQKYVSIPSFDLTCPSPHNTGGAVDLVIVKLPPKQAAILDRIDAQLMDDGIDFEDRASLETQKSFILRQHAIMLNFGTPFDHGSERAAIAYFEKQCANGAVLSPTETEARDNRRLLYYIMTKVGMQPYADEWWHFNAPESQMGAAAAGRNKAVYGVATLGARNTAHEKLRQRLYNVATRQKTGGDPRFVAHPWPIEVMGSQAL
jgi:D-alanyl-D-alanine dipeptidase